MTKLSFSTSDQYFDLNTLFSFIAETGPNPVTTPQIHPISWPLMWSYLQRAAMEGERFDISEIGSTWVPSFASMGHISEVDPAVYPQLSDPNRFVPSAWRSVSLMNDGRRFAVPYLADTRIVYYWKDILSSVDADDPSAFGTPSKMDTTLSELRAVGRPGWAAPTFGVTNIVHEIASWIWGGGGDFLSADGMRTAFCSEEAVAGIVSYFNLQRYMEYKHDSLDSVLETFERKKASVIISGPWFYQRLRRNHTADELKETLGTALPPGPPFVGGSALVVWKGADSEPQQSALEWAARLTSPQGQEAVCQSTGLLPVLRESFDSPPYSVDPHYEVFRQALKTGRPLPQVAYWGALEAELVHAFGNIWSDIKEDTTTSPERAVREHLVPCARKFDAALLRASLSPRAQDTAPAPAPEPQPETDTAPAP